MSFFYNIDQWGLWAELKEREYWVHIDRVTQRGQEVNDVVEVNNCVTAACFITV